MKRRVLIVLFLLSCIIILADEIIKPEGLNRDDFKLTSKDVVLEIEEDASSYFEENGITDPNKVLVEGPYENDRFLSYKSKEIEFLFLNDVSYIVMAIVSSTKYKTTRGISVNSTLEELFKAYDASQFGKSKDGYVAYFPQIMEGSGYSYSLYLHFIINDGLVSSIEIGETLD